MIEQVARDTLSAENLDQHDFISLSNGRIAYVLSNGGRVVFPQVSDIELDSQKDCPRILAAFNAIRDAEFPNGNSQTQDFALARVLLALSRAQEIAKC